MLFVWLIGPAAGVLSAGLYIYGLSLTASSVFVMLLCPLPLWLAGLSLGGTASGLAGVTGTLVAMLLVADPMVAAVYAGMFAIPTAVLVNLAAQRSRHPDGDGEGAWFPGGALIGALVVLGLLQVLVAALAAASTEEGLVGAVRRNLVVVFGAYVTEDTGTGTGALVDQWDIMVLGTIVAVVMLAQVGTGALAQGILVATGRALRPTPPFWTVRVGDWSRVLLVPLVAAVVALDATGLASGGEEGGFWAFLAMAFVLVLGVGFLLQGLAVMHALTRGMRVQPLVLAGAYLVALAFQPFGTALFALIGFFDRWGNFRERFGVDVDAEMED